MTVDKSSLRIVFFGTPAFAEHSLRKIHAAGYHLVAVVTMPDKIAGRGKQLQSSAVKKAALELGIKLLQPEKLKSPEFLAELDALQADLQIVIAFRMLPESVWNKPPLGTFNLHASYLPHYRGAAPINRALMNGETETGVSTFFLKHEIDTGQILLQKKIKILPEDDAGSLHVKLMIEGGELVLESLETICRGNYQLITQAPGQYKEAPKIYPEDCEINWQNQALHIHHQIRGLSPYPVAFTTFQGKKLKIFKAEMTEEPAKQKGLFEFRNKSQILVDCGDYKLSLLEVQLEGKKRMPAKDFINGLKPIL